MTTTSEFRGNIIDTESKWHCFFFISSSSRTPPPPRTLIKNVICKIPTSHYLKSTLTLFTHAYYTKSFSALINYSDRQMTFRSIYPGIVIGLGDIAGNEEKPVLTLPWVVDFYLYISKGVSLPNHIHALKRKMTIQIHLPCRGEIKHIGLTCFRSFLTPFWKM